MTPSNEGIAAGKAVGAGRYILNKQLGDNANFWLAHDEIENRPVVLKFLGAELHQDPRGMEELRNQIATATQISHANIARIFGLFEADGVTPFIIAEYIEGMNLPALQSMQPQRVFTWSFLAPLLKQILAAIQHAHEKGVVQGSLKPANLMLDRKGQVKILDIGIAGILNNPLYGAAPTLMPYLSPQQVDNAAPDVTDDIYSLGVVVYEFLTSTVPFHSGDILPQIRSTPAQPIQQRLLQLKIANPIPQIVNSIVMSCLDKSAAARPQNIETISNSIAIAEVEAQAPQPAPAPAPQAVVIAPPSAPVPAAPRPIHQASQAPAPVYDVAPAKKKAPVLALAIVVVVAMIGGVGGTLLWLNKKKSDDTANPAPQPVTQKQDKKPKVEPSETGQAKQDTKPPVTPTRPTVDPVAEAKAKKAARDAAELSRLAARSESGFINLFNGQDLTGWAFDSTYWSVVDGIITARAGSGAPPNTRTDLVWQQGTVEDFELRLRYRFRKMAGNNQATAGIEYRGVKTGDYNVNGYHYELNLSGDNTGMLTSHDRLALAVFTSKAFVHRNGNQDKIDTSSALEPFSSIANTIKLEDWNEVVILVQGNRLIHKINNHVVADVTDENDKKHLFSGLLALELNTGAKPGVFVQFKDIRLKRLSLK